jgi:hypothetical protein
MLAVLTKAQVARSKAACETETDWLRTHECR